jgi:hypothetical protein
MIVDAAKYVPKIALDSAEIKVNFEKTLFKYVDTSKDGLVDFYEFINFCKYLGLFLRKETFIEIFVEANLDNNNCLSPNEFKIAFTKLRERVLEQTIDYLGLTLMDLIITVILLLVLLLLLFVFIFFGVQAFSNINGLGQFVSPFLPVFAGIGTFIRLMTSKY